MLQSLLFMKLESMILQGVSEMWVKPEFEVIEVCAEVTAYAYQK